MSSGSDRECVKGVIRQGRKIVGAVSLPNATDVFIEQFNHCYGQLRLEVQNPVQPPIPVHQNPNTFRLPTWFRHVWHNRQPMTPPAEEQ
jgi:hypothetical protein